MLALLSLILAAGQSPTDSLIVEGAGKTVVLRVKDVAALPLPVADGTWRLIVPDDGRPARSAHLITALRVRTDS